MGALFRRPFAGLCMIFIISAAVGWFLGTVAKLSVIIAVGVAAVLSVLLTVFIKCSKRRRRKLIYVCVAIAVTLLSLVESYLYFDVAYLGKEKYFGDCRQIELTVTERLYTNSMSTAYSAKTVSIDGQSVECRAYFSTDGNSFIQPGFQCVFEGTVARLDEAYSGDERYMLSEGYLLYIECSDSGDVLIIDEDADVGFLPSSRKSSPTCRSIFKSRLAEMMASLHRLCLSVTGIVFRMRLRLTFHVRVYRTYWRSVVYT